MAIKKIPPSQWHKIKDLFESEFDSDMPSPEHADFYAWYEGTEIKAFVLAERVCVIGQIYTREDSNSFLVKKIINYLMDNLPKGISVAAVASEKRFEGLFRLFKMQKITGTLFRKDI